MTKKQLEAEKKAVQHILDKQQDFVVEQIFTDETQFNDEVEVKKQIKEEKPFIITNKKIDFVGRGFKSIEEAYDFVNTSYFKGLGKADQEEFKNWLK